VVDGKFRLLLFVGIGLLVKEVVVPMFPNLALANVFTRLIPLWLAPFNWVLFLSPAAVCEGPLLMERYVSVPLNILWLISTVFLMCSWEFRPTGSVLVFGIAYVGINWLLPLLEMKEDQ
jgi:hypothetical protein